MRRPHGSVAHGSVVLLALVACTSEPRPVLRPPGDEAKPPARATANADAVPAPCPGESLPDESGGSEAPESKSTARPPRAFPQLESFFAGLEALERHERATSLRLLWLGDSHTAADFMTHPLRARLQALGGNGGPGFVRLGLNSYRHGAARVDVVGKWRHEPIAPSQRTRVFDGVFGYGGIRTIPAPGSAAEIQWRGPLPEGEVEVRVLLRLGPGDGVEVRWGETRRKIVGEKGRAKSDVEEHRFVGRAEQAISVRHLAGRPEVFGVYFETVRPGVVLDTVGINGARLATALAWEPAQYEEALRRRELDLIVLAFGTNEAFDATAVEKYADQHREFLSLARRARPELPCWIVAAPDAATTDGRSITRLVPIEAVQRAAAAEFGCAFSSLRDLMGGEGSFARWTQSAPPWARSDRVHLTIAGYEKLGGSLADLFLGAGTATPDDASRLEPVPLFPPSR